MSYVVYIPHDKKKAPEVYPECDLDRLEELQEHVEQGRGRLIRIGDGDEGVEVLDYTKLSAYDFNPDNKDFEELQRKF